MTWSNWSGRMSSGHSLMYSSSNRKKYSKHIIHVIFLPLPYLPPPPHPLQANPPRTCWHQILSPLPPLTVSPSSSPPFSHTRTHLPDPLCYCLSLPPPSTHTHTHQTHYAWHSILLCPWTRGAWLSSRHARAARSNPLCPPRWDEGPQRQLSSVSW